MYIIILKYITVTSLKKYLLDEAKRKSKVVTPKFIKPFFEISSEQVCDSLDTRYSITKRNLFGSYDISFPEEKQPKNHVTTEDLFKLTNIYQENFASCSQQNKNATETKNIIIIGEAGAGKTTFLKGLLAKYAQDCDLYGYHFVFYIQCSMIDEQDERTFLEFLAKQLPYFWIKDIDISKAVIDIIEKTEKICIVLDGLDLGMINILSDSATELKIEQTASSRTYIKNILLKKLLPQAKVIITLRPLQFLAFSQLDMNIEHYKKVYILGLNHKNQSYICASVVSKKSKKILSYVNVYSTLKCFCLIPTNFFAVVHFVNTFMTTKPKNFIPMLHFTLVEIFLPSLLIVIWNHGLENSKYNLKCAVELAWKMFLEKKIFFNKKVVDEMHESCEILEVYFQIDSNKNLTFSEIVYNCLIAMHLLFFHDSFDNYITEDVKSEFFKVDGCFFEITRFLFGLCNQSVKVYLENLSSDFPIHIINDRKVSLKHFITSIVAKHSKVNGEIFAICSLLFEMHDEIFTIEISDRLTNVINIDNSFLTHQCAGLLYVLSKRTKQVHITFESNVELNTELLQLVEALENLKTVSMTFL